MSQDFINAVSDGDVNKVREMLEAADSDQERKHLVNLTSSSGVPLIRAAANKPDEKYLDVVSLLIENGADVNAGAGKDEFGTALHQAAIDGNNKMVALLLKNGAKVDAVDNANNTPLHSAATFGHAETVRLLINAGADTTAKDKYGRTPEADAQHKLDIGELNQDQFDKVKTALNTPPQSGGNAPDGTDKGEDKGFLGGLMDNFTKPSGIIGGLLAGVAGFFLGGGGMGGIIFAIIGALLGSLAGPAVSDMLGFGEKENGPGAGDKVKTVGVSHQLGKSLDGADKNQTIENVRDWDTDKSGDLSLDEIKEQFRKSGVTLSDADLDREAKQLRDHMISINGNITADGEKAKLAGDANTPISIDLTYDENAPAAGAPATPAADTVKDNIVER